MVHVAENKQFLATRPGPASREWGAHLVLGWNGPTLTEAQQKAAARFLMASEGTGVYLADVGADPVKGVAIISMHLETTPFDQVEDMSHLPPHQQRETAALSKAMAASLGALAGAGIAPRRIRLEDLFMQETDAPPSSRREKPSQYPELPLAELALTVFGDEQETAQELWNMTRPPRSTARP